MSYKDWNIFLQSKDLDRVKKASTQQKLLLTPQGKQRKEIWDIVIGSEKLAEYENQIQSFIGATHDQIKIDRFFDNILGETYRLFLALKDNDQTILNRTLVCLKIFLINNQFLYYNTCWPILLFNFNKQFDTKTAYQYFSHIILNILPKDLYNYQERCLVNYQYLHAFGLLASDNFQSLQTTLSLILKQQPTVQNNDVNVKAKENDTSVNNISIINGDQKKQEVKNRKPFFNLMEKVGEIYINGLILQISDMNSISQLLDISLFLGFNFILKMTIKAMKKPAEAAEKLAKTEISSLTKLKVAIDIDVMNSVAEKSFPAFQTKISPSDYISFLKQALEDTKLQTQIETNFPQYLVLCKSEQIRNESQLNFNSRIHAIQYLADLYKTELKQDRNIQQMLVKVASYGNAGYIERKKLAIILKEPNNDFKWTDIMIAKFDQLLSYDEYSNAKVKVILVQVLMTIISDLDTFEMKIRHILAIYGITDQSQLTDKQVISIMVLLELQLDNRQKIIEIEQNMGEKITGKVQTTYTLEEIVTCLCTQPVFSGFQSLLISVDQGYKNKHTIEEFQEIYRRPSANASFVSQNLVEEIIDEQLNQNESFLSGLDLNNNNNEVKDNQEPEKIDKRMCANCLIF